ncbi:hypothetical protein Q5M87_03400 [Brachyspira innocens]|uniref:Uncharacterized protein n=1 Tax=Brachyspira innocens TaxID=13264 RepID=A0ABT8YW72_9SPIR|nr:hypothetical protein [Brachyspira innocens]MDO6993050.1 hypothetical protein [Brachyspira innocens]MDO7019740.1 hypothetical protein [Brachyspira innocens]
MQILISVIINITILAVVLPLFYIYIVSKARERLEKETMSKAREEIEALVKEFNNIALSRISILEDAITRANKITGELTSNNKEIRTEDNAIKKVKENKEEVNNNITIHTEKKKLDIRVEDENVQLNIKPEENKKEVKENKEIKKEEVKKTVKKNNIDTAAKAIDDEARKEAIERLRSKLDRTIKSNMSIYDKNNDTDKKISKEEYNTAVSSDDKNANIIKLYKEGMSKEDIAKKLNCSITEIDIVIDLELE